MSTTDDKKAEATTAQKQTGELLFPDILGRAPAAFATVRDVAGYAAAQESLDFKLDEIAWHDDLLQAFAAASTRGSNFGGIWEQNLRVLIGDKGMTGEDEALQIAENTSPYRVAATTLWVRRDNGDGGEAAVPVHIVRNEALDKTLIVGEKVPENLSAAFRKANITYVGRGMADDATSQQAIDAALKDILKSDRGSEEYMRGRLEDALKYRQEERPPEIAAAMLLAPDMEASYAKYVVMTPVQPASIERHHMLHALEEAGADGLLALLEKNPAALNWQLTEQVQTPLMIAAGKDNRDQLRLLIDRGAVLDAQDADGRTALSYAVQDGHFEAAQLLKAAGARADIKDFSGMSVAESYDELLQIKVMKPVQLKPADKTTLKL